MEIQEKIKKEIIQVFEDELNYKCSIDNINIDQTPKNFDGLYTLILFPHLKHLKENLNEVGKKIGEGVFGVSFKLKGPPKNIKTTVNPIKTLTPRFITRTLEKIKKAN